MTDDIKLPPRRNRRNQRSQGVAPGWQPEPKAQITKAQAKGVIKVILSTGNSGFTAGAKMRGIELDPDDPLKPEEIALLSEAITEEVWRSEQAKKWIARAATLTNHGQLLFAISVVAAPRLERRGILAPGTTQSLYEAIAISVATGGSFSSSGGDGIGEVNSSSNGTVATEDFLGGNENETGSDRVPSGSDNEQSTDTELSEVQPDRTKTRTTVPSEGTA